MQTTPTQSAPCTDAQLVDYAASLDCVHCGLCLRTCPTYELTGRESASPRGRIHMMRSVAEGELKPDAAFIDELDLCLLCRHCESACPSGVNFAAMLEHTRARLLDSSERSWLVRRALGLGLGRVLPSPRWIAFLAGALRFLQRLGLVQLASRLPGKVGQAAAACPPVPPARERRALPRHTPALGQRRGSVSVLEGCIMPPLLGRVNRATVAVLAAAGREVHCPRGASCCGSLHAHNGDLQGARELARRLIDKHSGLLGDDGELLPIVTNSAGCSSHMKHYGALLADDADWAERAAVFGKQVFDFSEYLVRFAFDDLRPALGPLEVAQPICWDDPCHLCHGQGIRDEPRALLDALSIERVELKESESCCGSAGLYSVLRPLDSRAILAPRLAALKATGARTLVSANPGCQLQWSGGLRQTGSEVEVLHIAELLERALAHGRESGE